VPGEATACPGNYFPLQHFKSILGGVIPLSKRPTLRKGDSGSAVKELQERLIALGYGRHLEPYGADGKFGNATERAVLAFQRDNGQVQDGIVGPKTKMAS